MKSGLKTIAKVVSGKKTLPKMSGPVGGMASNVPKAGMGGLLGGMSAKPRTTGTPKPPVRSTPTPTQTARAGLNNLVSKAKLPAPSGAKRVMSEPKPVIRSTAKPAMPSRKK